MTERCNYSCIYLQPDIYNFSIGKTVIMDLTGVEFHCLAQNGKIKGENPWMGVPQKSPEKTICEVPEKRKLMS